ncbi:MAG TPA: cbb3-type cytochrome c oxidase subunit 3 [Rhizobiaceae bacterium]|nr:cbb3-type cytochrome c oxidase subunit 3 [Rhizobiaceae bacterium]
MDYHTLRAFADSWAMLAMLIFFVGMVLWVLRPGASKSMNDAARIPFAEDENNG